MSLFAILGVEFFRHIDNPEYAPGSVALSLGVLALGEFRLISEFWLNMSRFLTKDGYLGRIV